MNKYAGKVRIGVIGVLSVAALAIVGLHRFSRGAYGAAPAPTLFVTDDFSEAVTTYAAASNGDVSPLAPAPTGLVGPQFVAVDASGNIYITNDTNSNQTITIYAKGSNSDAAPIAIIGGSNTGLSAPVGIALDSTGKIYVADASGSVFVYPALGSSTGVLNEAPIATISGSNTGLSEPFGIALDSSGKIYVTDANAFSVFVYAALGGSTGLLNEAPTATICGSNTGLMGSPEGIALDSSGKIYVADPGADPASVFVYPALGSSTGLLNEAPIATISGSNTGLVDPIGIALDSSGKIYVADPGADPASVFVYPALGSSTGLLNEAPVATISGSNTALESPQGVALDSNGKIYVADGGPSGLGNGLGPGSVYVYPALGSSTGTLNEAPTAAISSAITTGLERPQGIALDSSGKIYVADDGPSGFGPGSVFVYPAGSNANAAPIATISGSNTGQVGQTGGLIGPEGIALDSSGKIYVADPGADPASVFVYPALGSSTGLLNEAPTAAIGGFNTGLVAPFGIALDSSGKIYVADNHANSVFVYPALGSSTGTLNEAPIATISGSNTGLSLPFGIALDSSGKIYVADTDAVFVYSALGSSTGLLNEAPIATISGSNTGLMVPIGIALDSSLNIYVADELAAGVFVYPALGSSTGLLDGTPTATISGPLTELSRPLFVAVQSETGPTPTPTATATGSTSTPTRTATATATPTPTATSTGSSTPTATTTSTAGTPTATATRTATATASPSPTATATPTTTATPTSTPTPGPGMLKITPASGLNFGKSTKENSTSKPKTVTIKNDSSKKSGITVTITGETTDPPFTVSRQCMTSLAPGKSCKVSVTFTPPNTTEQTGTLTINDNAAGAPQKVPLSGTGKAAKKK